MSNLERDTSPNKNPIKNPILNPILHSASLIAPDLSMTTLLPPEPKSLVTVSYGESSTSDSENLDEINLNPAPENLGPPAIIDTNSNSEDVPSDSLLSQAASSFSALPSVASSVLSTFSKRIYAGNSREQTPSLQDNTNANVVSDSAIEPPSFYDFQSQRTQPQRPIQPTLQQQDVLSAAANTTNLNFLQYTSHDSTLPEPPKLYAPAEVPVLAPPASVCPPPSSGGAQNNYRLAAKKKLYAPIPGLSGQTVPPLPSQVSPLTTSGGVESSLQDNTFSYDWAQQAPPNAQAEQKGGLFSLTNLVPSGVLQNITGLVQTAAGTISQSVKSESKPNNSFFETPNIAPQSFNPAPELSTTNFFLPPPQLPGAVPFSASQTTPEVAHSAIESSTSTNFFAPPPQPPSAVPFSADQISQPIAQKSIEPLNTNIGFQAPLTEPPNTLTPLTVPLFLTAATGVVSNTAILSTNVNFFDPNSNPSCTPLVSASHTQVGSSEALAPPPSSGQVSFRLQKGTRLYKNPLHSTEIAQSFVSPQQQALNFSPQPQAFFNPNQQNYFEPQQTFDSPNLTPQSSVSFNKSLEISNANNQSQSFGEVIAPLKEPDNTTPATETASPQEAALQCPANSQNVNSVQKFLEPFPKSFEDLNISSQQSSYSSEKSTVEFFNPEKVALTEESEHVLLNPSDLANQNQESNTNQHQTSPFTSSAQDEQTQASLSQSLDYLNNSLDILNQYNRTHNTENLLKPISELLPPTVSPVSGSNVALFPETKEIVSPFLAATESSNKQQNFLPIDNVSQTTTVGPANPEISSSFSVEQAGSNAGVSLPKDLLPPPPPPSSSIGQKSGNPYRKSSTDALVVDKAPPSLASFFMPSAATNHFEVSTLNPTLNIDNNATNDITSFFGDISVQQKPQQVLPQTVNKHPEVPNFFNTAQNNETTVPVEASSIPPPIGFETFSARNPQITSDISQPTATAAESRVNPHNETTKTFSNFFINEEADIQKTTVNPFEKQHSFFDSLAAETSSIATVPVGIAPAVQSNNDSLNSNEDQKIQNFFNNPPPKENSSGVGDLNYDLVHSGLGVRTQHTGSLTTASNVVEPPSSICSEVSELNNFTTNQQRLLPAQIIESTNSQAEQKLNAVKNDIENLSDHYNDLPETILQELRKMSSEKATTAAASMPAYSPAVKHWFYKRLVGQKHIWTPFSHFDNALLETSLTADKTSNIVSVEGGRYDVHVVERIKTPVYWEGEPIEVRRCSWFYKASDSKYVPYDEDTADRLEEEYRQAAESGVWHKKIIIANHEQVVFHGPTVIVHFQQQQNVDAWGGTSQTTSRPRVVKRDLDDFTIEVGESLRADHLLLMVHGIGSACDLKMRTVEEVVDDFRSIAQQLVQSHYKNSTDMGIVGRVEVLPISWHSHLHSEEMGIDEKLKSITLESIPKLRNFTNDTLLDVLFYTSPTYCQKIVNTVASEMNTIYLRYRERHPDFSGGVSLAGHSLGSLILFDLLCHQHPIKESEEQNLENPNQTFPVQPPVQNVTSQQIGYTMGPAGTGQPYIQYGQLVFHPKKFFALGSPIGMFATIRGIDKLGLDFRLPTCPGFYNIFHPFDPVAYRIEALVNPDMSGIRPVLIPHHKGRKRMHLELKETMTRVGADLKQRFLDTFKTTLESVNFMGTTRSKREAQESMEKEVDQVLAMQMEMENDQEQSNETAADVSQLSGDHPATSARSRANSNSTNQSDTDLVEIDFPLGKLNDSKRIDYVLQEAPLEFFNEYLFALSSHVCYWDSSDTILFVMKEIYSGLGISPDSQIPQQTMTIERPSSRNSVSHSILPPTN